MRWRCPNQRRGRCRIEEMMQLVAWCVHGCLVADVLLPEHTQEAPLTAHVEHISAGDRREWWPMLQSHIAKRRQPGHDTC